MTMKKRFLSLILAAGMVAAALPMSALAEEEAPDQIVIELPPVQYEELSRLPGSIIKTEEETAPDAGSVPDRQGSGQSAPARGTGSDGSLKIRVKTGLSATEQVLLYQEAVTLNLKNFYGPSDREIQEWFAQNQGRGGIPIEEFFQRFGNFDHRSVSAEDGPALTQEMLIYLYLVGLMEGGDGSFQLDRPVTQGEFVKMTVAALGQDPEETAEGAFWAEGYVKKAVSDGWLTAAAEEFDSDKTVSWQEAEAMLARAMGREDVSDLDLTRGAAVDFADQPLFRDQTAVIFCNFLGALAETENQ